MMFAFVQRHYIGLHNCSVKTISQFGNARKQSNDYKLKQRTDSVCYSHNLNFLYNNSLPRTTWNILFPTCISQHFLQQVLFLIFLQSFSLQKEINYITASPFIFFFFQNLFFPALLKLLLNIKTFILQPYFIVSIFYGTELSPQLYNYSFYSKNVLILIIFFKYLPLFSVALVS